MMADPPSQVLAEIQNPRRNFAWISSLAVGVICILFMLINILYVRARAP